MRNNIAKHIQTLTLSLLMMLLGGIDAWGQTDPYEGTWYLTNGNNYYLCPAAGYWQGNVDTPYLTTYQTNKDNNSIWTIVPVDVSGTTYYRIIHNATGKYITANDAISGFNAGYLRLHLESFDTPSDATLFIIVTHNSKIGIRSKDYDDAANNHYWFDISQGNKGNLWQDNGQGQLGFWYGITTDAGGNTVPDNNSGAPWQFQTANPICATPIITYNESDDTFTISYLGDATGVSIHYTTDGTAPTSSSTAYSTAIPAASVTTKLRAIAVKTDYTDSYEAIVYGAAYSATPHLFKTSDYQTVSGVNSYYDFSYYLISPVDDADAIENRNYLTTSNVPNERMQWYIKPATAASGVQYHYIVNAATDKYIYFTGTNISQGSKFVVKDRNEAGLEDDRFMFRIWEGTADGIDYFNFSPKLISGYPPSHKKENFLTKQNSTDHNNPTGVYKDNDTYGRARWQMIDVPVDPKTLSALPAGKVSTASNSIYFKLRSATQDDSGNDYFVYPPSSAAYATAATSGTNPEWYFVEATDADTWNTYYHIRNAQTGHYLYFDSETRYNNNDNKFLTSASITSGSEDKYKFLVLRTARTQAIGSYHIVPKAIRNNNNQANIALSRENKTSAKLRSSNSRDNNNACWYLDAVDFKCAVPTFSFSAGNLTITCSTEGASIYYAVGESEPAISDANRYTGSITLPDGSSTFTAIAVRSSNGSDKSEAATFTIQTVSSGDQITNMNGFYTLAANFTPSSAPIGTEAEPFRGTIDGGLHTISGLSHPLFAHVENAVIRNIILDNVNISSGDIDGNAGAIACVATGSTRIYNCGILDTESSSISGSQNVGSLVGLLDGTARVINCYSYATVSGGTMMGGIVGRNNQTSKMNDIKTIVVNCMFYGEISGGGPGTAYPVYGGNLIDNSGTNAINNYNYFRSEAEFDNVYNNISNYNRSWPAEEKYLTRFEYYRNILNSNRRLCTWWVNGANGTAPTDADVETVGIAKWVLDTSIAPYPILKKWGKYPSVINPTPVNSLGTLRVTVNPGSHNNTATSKEVTLTITDMDEASHDYGYYKVQLPYYNELFGNPTSNVHATRYGNNYTNMVVTGWEITTVIGGTEISDKKGTDADGIEYDHTFTANWESGYNFADRYCTDKDKYSVSGRVFAQGGYYYVPEGVTEITITAHWGTAVYVRNADNSVDRINVTSAVGSGSEFTPAGKLPSTFQDQTVFTSIQDAIKSSSFSNLSAGKTVYDQAVVLVGNIQVRNGSSVVNYSGTNAVPYTLMSADFDLDNEPDFCLQLQFRNDLLRPRIQPVRFDFLSIPELGLAIRPDNKAWAIGIMVPAGHFEITETACMHTTQFEYDANISKVEAPVILNGGHFEQIVVRYGSTSNSGISNRTSYFIMGGHFWMKRFTPGAHTNTGTTPKIRHCAVSVMGGEYPEFYLSGIYRTIVSYVDNPHCYINGGRFGTIAGAGMEQISGDITFKIDHAIIDEFYGGGINASLPVLGKIDVTIDHSRVGKYCGGPKVGILGTKSAYKTVTTHATGSTFGEYYGGGNGGTSYFREQKQDGDKAFPAQSANGWKDYGYSGFNPLNTINGVAKTSDNSATNKGYHAEYEFEVFNNSNGTTDQAVVRAYYQWAQFGTTATGTVTNFLKDCIVNGNFYGGGNLGNVNGNVNSTLTGETHIAGSAFAAGYSAAIPKFRIHDKENATTNNFPARDFAGVITEHTLDYKKDDSGNEIYYTWSNELPPGTKSNNAKDNPTFQKDGKWYCYTWESLEGLGAVSGNTTLTIKGSSIIDGSVYGGGDESAVTGNTTVTLKGNTRVLGNVFGGGDNGVVEGSTKVEIVKDDE